MKSLFRGGIITITDVRANFVSTVNPAGISKNVLTRLIKYAFDVSTWGKAVAQCGAMPSPEGQRLLTPQEYRDAGGKSLQEYWKHKIGSLIVKHVSLRKIIRDGHCPELSYKVLSRKVNFFWTSYQNAQNELFKPRLALAFKLYSNQRDWADRIAEVCPFIPYAEDPRFSSKSEVNLKYWTIKLFNGETAYTIRHFFRTRAFATVNDLYVHLGL